MRPIYLKLAGLQSYRETQVIDFVSLSETGIFGIFGPTGSGKSSILDAITLALYGKVERAKNRAGIMNDSEKSLTVSFTFEIGTRLKRTRYRVERRYKRGEGASVSASLCKLYRYDDAVEIPIADKEQEVNPAIRQIIGLTVDDFTRAVVLPQGKFAEFLSLTGGDRTKMLQRIFSLENYGQALSERIKLRADSARESLSSIEGQQIGLGDCSRESILRVQSELAAAEDEFTKIQGRYTLLRQEYENKKELLGIIEELKALKLKREEHLKDAQRHSELARRLKRAEAAEPLRPLIQTRDNAQNRLAEIRNAYDRGAAAFECVKALQADAVKAYQGAKEASAAEEPVLLRRKAVLEDALQWEEEFNTISAQLKDSDIAYSELNAQISDLSKTRDSLVYRYDELKSDIAGLENELTSLKVEPEVRARLQEAKAKAAVLRDCDTLLRSALSDENERIRELSDKESLLNEASNRLSELSGCFERVQKTLSEHLEKKPADDAALVSMSTSLSRLESAINGIFRIAGEVHDLEGKIEQYGQEGSELLISRSEWDRQFDQAKLSAERAYEEKLRARSSYDNAVLGEAAASLAKHLSDGTACPVCGSMHHPAPVDTAISRKVDKLRSDYEKAEADDERCRRVVSEVNEEIVRLQTSIDALRLFKEEAEGRKKALISDADELRRKLPAPWQSADLDGLAQIMLEEKTKYGKAVEDFAEWSRICTVLSEQEASLREEMAGAGTRYAAVKAETDGLKAAVDQAVVRSSSARARLEGILGEFRAVSGDMAPDIVEEESRLLLERDLRYRELSSVYEEKRKLLTDLQSKISNIDVALAEHKQRSLSLNDLIIEKKCIKDSLNEKLDTETGGMSPRILMDELDERLAGMKDEILRLENVKVDAELKFQTTANQVASYSASLAEAQDRLDESASRLDTIIQESDFTSVADALEALMTADERRKLSDAVHFYAETERSIDADESRLEKARNGRELKPDEWLFLNESLKQAEDSYASAGQEVAVLKHNLVQLSKAKERWDVLESERLKFSLELGRLQKLQSLLKANAFVQFLTEEQMTSVVSDASARLALLTGQRYHLEISAVGDFAIRDYMNGGCLRPVTTLSGGETFLTSLSLALALSSQIQLKGESPLEFFFLDEGFGTLDQELLDTVMTALERLHLNNMTIGIISHVPELRARTARRLIVEPPDAGMGSKLRLELG